MKSIRHRLLLWLLSGLLLAVAAAGVRIYYQTLAEANELFDYHLKQMAASLPSDAFGPVPPARLDEHPLEDELIVQIWDRSGVQLYFSRPESQLPQHAEVGFSTIATPAGSWASACSHPGWTPAATAYGASPSASIFRVLTASTC